MAQSKDGSIKIGKGQSSLNLPKTSKGREKVTRLSTINVANLDEDSESIKKTAILDANSVSCGLSENKSDPSRAQSEKSVLSRQSQQFMKGLKRRTSDNCLSDVQS